MRAIVLLADAAVADQASGKVHLLGAGWTITGSPLPGHAVVALVGVPWDQREFLDRLEDLSATPHAGGVDQRIAVPVALEGKLEVGRPPGLPPGSVIDAPFVVSFPPGLPLSPGRYVWQLEINEEQQEAWSAGFLVR